MIQNTHSHFLEFFLSSATALCTMANGSKESITGKGNVRGQMVEYTRASGSQEKLMATVLKFVQMDPFDMRANGATTNRCETKTIAATQNRVLRPPCSICEWRILIFLYLQSAAHQLIIKLL